MSGLLVIGGGIAGQAVCEELRLRDADIPLTLLCGEARLPYDRIALSQLLAGEAGDEDLQLRPDEWYADRAIDVRVGARAAWLRPHQRLCGLEDGSVVGFEGAVLCTGSDPLVPPIPGVGL